MASSRHSPKAEPPSGSKEPRTRIARARSVLAGKACKNKKDNRRISDGLPHSEISGSKPIPGSPKLIAGYHVFHRLLLPRHPPNALFALDHQPRRKKIFSLVIPRDDARSAPAQCRFVGCLRNLLVAPARAKPRPKQNPTSSRSASYSPKIVSGAPKGLHIRSGQSYLTWKDSFCSLLPILRSRPPLRPLIQTIQTRLEFEWPGCSKTPCGCADPCRNSV